MVEPNEIERPQRRLHRLPAQVYAYTGHEFYFTVYCARHQRTPFNNPRLANIVIESLLWTRERYGWVLFCYCLMPDHLHFICRLTNREDNTKDAGIRGSQPEGVLDHVGRFKSYTTTASWKLGFRGSLWQKGSYDRIIDLDKPFEEIVRYILDNPVRMGLVTDWRDWPYSAIVDRWEV